jgi:DNA-directed RNA polymerase subunit omega
LIFQVINAFHFARTRTRSVSLSDPLIILPNHTSPKLAMDDSNIIPFDQSEPKPGAPSTSMKSSLVVKASEIIKDPQILVNVVSKRVAQLNQGRSPLIETLPSMGAADIALTEIIEGKVVIAKPEGK